MKSLTQERSLRRSTVTRGDMDHVGVLVQVDPVASLGRSISKGATEVR